ncbi:MAG: hypothetical protein GY751_00185 [Bacteroidetes bacterium]|nr:hypothetical protein [Bacteroidota bacterium]
MSTLRSRRNLSDANLEHSKRNNGMTLPRQGPTGPAGDTGSQEIRGTAGYTAAIQKIEDPVIRSGPWIPVDPAPELLSPESLVSP